MNRFAKCITYNLSYVAGHLEVNLILDIFILGFSKKTGLTINPPTLYIYPAEVQRRETQKGPTYKLVDVLYLKINSERQIHQSYFVAFIV